MYLVVINEELIFDIESCINNQSGLKFIVSGFRLSATVLKRQFTREVFNQTANIKP